MSSWSESEREGEEARESSRELIPCLPDEVAVNCLARVRRSEHPTLSLVSKPIRSLISSPLFFNARSLLNSTQHCLYLTLRTRDSSIQQCFTLHNNNDNHNFLVPIPPLPTPAVGAAHAVIGSAIYIIGGSIHDVPSSQVWLLDCRFHRWSSGPSMRVGREFAAAGVIDGKIYVIGGCLADSWSRSTNWAEVFDPVSGEWQGVPSPPELREKWMHASTVLDGKVYAMADRGGVAFHPRSGAWESVGSQLDIGWRGRACAVDGILYCYDFLGKIKGFDMKSGMWKNLKGLEDLPRFLCGATLADVGGKLFVLWECQENGTGKEMEIWCAEIELTKKTNGELWGKVEWFNKVLSVPNGSSIVHCSSVAL